MVALLCTGTISHGDSDAIKFQEGFVQCRCGITVIGTDVMACNISGDIRLKKNIGFTLFLAFVFVELHLGTEQILPLDFDTANVSARA